MGTVYFTVTQENDRELVFSVLYTAGAVLTRAWTLSNNCGHWLKQWTHDSCSTYLGEYISVEKRQFYTKEQALEIKFPISTVFNYWREPLSANPKKDSQYMTAFLMSKLNSNVISYRMFKLLTKRLVFKSSSSIVGFQCFSVGSTLQLYMYKL